MIKPNAKAKNMTLDPREIRLGDIDQLCRTYRCMKFERLVTFRGGPYLTGVGVYKEDHKTLSSYKREIMSRLNWAIKAEVRVTFEDRHNPEAN